VRIPARVLAIDLPPFDPCGGFFAFARIVGCADSHALAMRLLEEAHVVTIPGSAFGHSGEGCLRLSFGSVDADSLGEALERLETFFGRRD
jgi:aminotransferase